MDIGIHGPASESSRGANIAAVAAASAARATSSLEKTLDEATDRYAVSPEVQRELRQLKAGLSSSAALAVSTPQTEALSLAPRRLRWRGREVSDEFQRYAERVASGEELAPYHGQVLARPCVDSPWGVPEQPLPPPASRSVVVGALLAASAWLVGVLLVAPRPPAPDAELRLLPTTALYATPAASSQLGALSLSESAPLGDVASGEMLSHDDVARAMGSSITNQRATRAVSARRRGTRSAVAAAPILAPAAVLAPEADGEPSVAPSAPASEAADDFAWLLDGAEGTSAEAPAPEAAPPPAARRSKRASAGATPAVPGSALLLEIPPF